MHVFMILRHVQIELDSVKSKVLPHDLYLLCSDGLTDMVEDDVISGALKLEMSFLDTVCTACCPAVSCRLGARPLRTRTCSASRPRT